MRNTERFSRRTFLGAGASASFAFRSLTAQTPSGDHGRVKPPVPLPSVQLKQQDGVVTNLLTLAAHRATALQVMFTGCTTTCPIQAAIFGQVQKLIPDQVARGIQLVSLSVDPEHDEPQALQSWLKRFHAGSGWIAASPERTEDLQRVKDFFGQVRSALDNHSTRVFLVNRDGLLIWRTFELPAAEEIAGILQKL